MDRKLIVLALIALICETTWLLADLRIIQLPLFVTSKVWTQTPVAGVLEDLRSNVRRRNQGSFVWEESSPKDTIYYYDSILTLSNSSARVKIDNDLFLDLSENTLVVVEPPNPKNPKQIRLVFSKGDVSTRSLKNNVQIESPTWTLSATPGSDVRVQSQENGKMSVEIKTGKALLTAEGAQNQESVQELQSGSVVSISDGQPPEVKNVSTNLSWDIAKKERYYIHSKSHEALVRWHGPASQLTLQRPGESAKTVDVEKHSEFAFSLTPGNYSLRLQAGEEISDSKQIEVRTAPVHHLLYPQPRDRFDVGSEVDFSWIGHGSSTYYVLQFSKDPEFRSLHWQESTRQTSLRVEPKESGAFFWRILAIDDEGFIVPPLYQQQVFFAADPLAPPKLRSVTTQVPQTVHSLDLSSNRLPATLDTLSPPPPPPMLSAPASEQAPPSLPNEALPSEEDPQTRLNFWWGWLIPAVQAQQVLEPKSQLPAKNPNPIQALFEWEPVPGATHYILEVDTKGDFISPSLITTVYDTRFLWNEAPSGIVFWRVAAGNDQRMGYFSLSQKITLTATKAKTNVPLTLPTKKPLPLVTKKPKLPIVAVKAPPLHEEKKPTLEPPPPPISSHQPMWQLTLGSGFSYLEQTTLVKGARAETHYAGILNAPIFIQWTSSPQQDHQWDIQLELTQRIWRAAQQSVWPFQPELRDMMGELRFGYPSLSKRHVWYISWQSQSTPISSDLESLRLESQILWGIDWRYFLIPRNQRNQLFTHFSLQSSGNMARLETGLEFQRHMEYYYLQKAIFGFGFNYGQEQDHSWKGSYFKPRLFLRMPF